MKSVFDYLDYRDLLKDAYEARKASSPLFSYRIMADYFGLDSSNIFRMLQKDLHLPARCHPRAIEFLGLSGRAADYFLLLTSYARERSSNARQEILEKALALRDVARRHLADQELAIFRDWWVVAIRCFLEVVDGRVRAEEIASRLSPSIPAADVTKALETLQELGLIKKVSSGRLVQTEAHLTASDTAGGDEKTAAIRHFQRQILSLASESLERFPRDHRDVSTLTLTVDKDAFMEIREMLRECRRQIQKRVEDSKNPDRVMQLAMAFFPLAPAKEEGSP